MTDFFPQFAQQLVNGLTLGAIYALIAIGYSMVYGIIGMIACRIASSDDSLMSTAV